MGVGFDEQQQLKQQMDQILHQETRVATDMSKVKEGYDQQFYSVEQTQQDKSLIQKLLYGPVRLQMSDNEKYLLNAIQGRNISHLLLNNQKTFGDSTEMIAVKNDVAKLETLLNTVRNNTMTVDEVRELETAYQMAIASCKYYCDNKNPTFQSGMDRKQMVMETLQHLQQEAQHITRARELIANGTLRESVTSAKDLLILAQEHSDPVQKETQEEQPKSINTLTYADFAAMIGTHNRGQVEFSGNGLQLINNGIFSSSNGTVSAENYELRERFLAVTLQKLGDQATPELLARLNHTLGLDQGGDQSVPLSRRVIWDIVSEVNELTSIVAKTMKQGKNASPVEHRLAKSVNDLVGGNLEDEDRLHTTSEQQKQLRTEITNILTDVKKFGIEIPSLTKHQMDNLVNGNISLLRDNIFLALNKTYESMCNLAGGNVANFNKLADDKESVTRIAALTIAKMAATTEAGRAAADLELRTYMTEAAFKCADQQALHADFKNMHVGMLASGGAAGLNDAVIDHLPHCPAWRNEEKKMKLGFDSLTNLCNKLRDISDLESKALNEGLTAEEATQMTQAAQLVQSMLEKEIDGEPNPILEAMDFVASELKTSRFAVGLQQAKELLANNFSFVNAAKHITDATTHLQNTQELEEQRRVAGIGDQPQPAQTKATAADLEKLLGKLDKTTREAVSVLLLENSTAEYIKNHGEDISADILALRTALRSFPPKEVHVANVHIGNVSFQLVQKKSGLLQIAAEHQTITLPFSSELLADRLDSDMISNEQIYGEENTKTIIENLATKTDAEIIRSRMLCFKVLESRTKHPSAFFNNVPIEALKQLTLCVLNNYMTADGVEKFVTTTENNVSINGHEALELLKQLEMQQNADSVEVEIVHAQKKEEEEKSGWTKEEEKVKDFLADMIYSKDTWISDNTQKDPVERIKQVLVQNSDALMFLCLNPELLKNMLDKFPLPDASNEEKSKDGKSDEEPKMGAKEQILETFNGFFSSGASIMLKMAAKNAATKHQGDDAAQSAQFKKALASMLKLGSMFGGDNSFLEMEASINKAVKESTDQIQTVINKSIDSVFKSESDTAAQPEQSETQQKDKKEKSQEKGKKAQPPRPLTDVEKLEKIIKDAASGSRGQGKFTKLVLQGYFNSVENIDKRAMLASALRNAKPVPKIDPALPKPEQEKIEKGVKGNFLGGVLKGAGPLLQKMLQGMPLDSMPEELRDALKDMRSNLAPIPEEIVKAQLKGIATRSKGAITKVQLQRALGAASVGQAFLCKLYGPGLPEDGKEVVVKLLRPDVRNRMMREKAFMRKCAENTDENGGMLATYDGQLKRIEEELDLTIEAKNAQVGKVYNKTFQTVKSMNVDPLVEPTVNTLVLEKAPGTTVDRYLDEVRSLQKNSLEQFYTHDQEGNVKTKTIYKRDEKGQLIRDKEGYLTAIGKRTIFSPDSNAQALAQAHQKLTGVLTQLQKRQEYLTQLAHVWVTEGIYGEGFYHGDLHAGNMMIDDNGLTVIDFGNATKLTQEQIKQITLMMTAAAAGNMQDFRHGFHVLLQNTSEEEYQSKRDQLGEAFQSVFSLGGVQQSGQRIAAALIKAQELGFELPSAIFNFSQCQLRLQQSIDEANTLIKSIQCDLRGIQEFDPVKKLEKEQFTLQPDMDQLNSKVDQQTRAARLEFDDNYMNLYKRDRALVEQFTQLLKNLLPSAVIDQSMATMASGSLRAQLDLSMEAIALFFDWTETDKFEQFKKDINDCLNNPGTAESQEMGMKLGAMLEKRMDALNEELSALRKAQDNKDSTPEQINELKEKFANSYSKYHVSRALYGPHYEQLRKNLADPKLHGEADKDLAPFLKEEAYGKEVQKAYEDFCNAQKNQSPDLAEAEHRLLDLCRHAEMNIIAGNISDIKNIPTDHAPKFIDPDNFFDVMAQIIKQNVTSSIRRLGLGGLIKYGWKLRNA